MGGRSLREAALQAWWGRDRQLPPGQRLPFSQEAGTRSPGMGGAGLPEMGDVGEVWVQHPPPALDVPLTDIPPPPTRMGAGGAIWDSGEHEQAAGKAGSWCACCVVLPPEPLISRPSSGGDNSTLGGRPMQGRQPECQQWCRPSGPHCGVRVPGPRSQHPVFAHWEPERPGGQGAQEAQGVGIYHRRWDCFTSVSTSTALNAGPGSLHGKRLAQRPVDTQQSCDYLSNVLISYSAASSWGSSHGCGSGGICLATSHVVGPAPVAPQPRQPTGHRGAHGGRAALCHPEDALPHAGAAQPPGGPASPGPLGPPLLPHLRLHQQPHQPHQPHHLLPHVPEFQGGHAGAKERSPEAPSLPHHHQPRWGLRDPPPEDADGQEWGRGPSGSWAPTPAAGAWFQHRLRAALPLPGSSCRPWSAPCWVLSAGG
ncbi:uncharacterized protein LOC116658786 [Camelus ferus]|uniref:Uncharacterized protein LOC116658786 n=1 Tax=Camelus ferus TaxID=419612 RepID=A0A8B8RR72_CAMFR|nr:uncharacterized protein LOC116658786 [Camelus ferus]XP_032320437.1 uncharacterized protein LOC116658786 [Camelus ferus]XP_032320439.1 uncharacterized protein LOC116658786 [Camelus ferus]XP_032320440.1 uncharacterized protein LOC116658786 [Camelus ferus]XP_032320441.1 uncharacterized protein LOC116658786 [Camelus ferus]